MPGVAWPIEAPEKKLALRATLPGALLFDFVADSLHAAKAAGLPMFDRLRLALPASWLVNSPSSSLVLRRWALPPHRDTWLVLLRLLDRGPETWAADPASHPVVAEAVAALGNESYVVEATSKVAALLAPEVVPLMPEKARHFVLGAESAADSQSFAAMVDWFVAATLSHRNALDEIAAKHDAVKLTGAAVLDRLLWFDSDGHRHFARERDS
ncbi:MAG: hypothetical protein M3O46_02260 [Myxococcota bacterium]|nr:hypothetical protein [Myxococcota bacterium]